MATKKKRPAPRVARWFFEIGKDQARERGFYKPDADIEARANYLATKRELRIKTLSENVKRLRQVFPDFDPAAGYNLHDIRSWPKARVKRVDQYAEYVNHLRSQPFSLVRPRNKKQRAALQQFTGQQLPKQKRFIVHKPTDADDVSIDRNGRITIARELPSGAGFLESQYYLFLAILGYRPVTWDELYAATVEILPYMPEGKYFIYSELHGEISTPHEKRMLPRLIQRMGEEYEERDFAGTIIGFKRVSDQVKPDKEYERIYFRRQATRAEKLKAWNRLRRKAERKSKRR